MAIQAAHFLCVKDVPVLNLSVKCLRFSLWLFGIKSDRNKKLGVFLLFSFTERILKVNKQILTQRSKEKKDIYALRMIRKAGDIYDLQTYFNKNIFKMNLEAI